MEINSFLKIHFLFPPKVTSGLQKICEIFLLSNKKMRVIWNFPETRLEFLISSWIHSMILPAFAGDITKDAGDIIPLVLFKVIV